MRRPKATGAKSGKPGSFTPTNAEPPADLAELKKQVTNKANIDPATKWPAGEWVALGNNSEAHWEGAAWASGKAP